MSGRWPPVVFWIFEQWIGVTMLRKGRLRLPGADFALFKSTFPGIPSATSKWTWKCGSQTFKRCERACCGGYVFINNTWQSTPLECVWNEVLSGLCLVGVWLLNLSRQSFPGCFEPGGFLWKSNCIYSVRVFASLRICIVVFGFAPPRIWARFPTPTKWPTLRLGKLCKFTARSTWVLSWLSGQFVEPD